MILLAVLNILSILMMGLAFVELLCEVKIVTLIKLEVSWAVSYWTNSLLV